MKYCAHCGKELSEETQICTGCGCVSEVKVETTSNEIKSNKAVPIIIISVFAAVVLVVIGLFFVNHNRKANVLEDLSGEEFRYYDSQSYPLLGVYHYTEKEMKFDDDGKLTYSYYYSNISSGGEYERDYEIKFKDKMIILQVGDDEFEVQYDKYDKIKGIYDIELKELYE